MNEPSTSQEIDLKLLFRPFLQTMIGLKQRLVSYWKAIKRTKWWIVGFVVLILATTLSLRTVIPRYYSTKAIFVSHTLDATICSSILESLSEIAGNKKNAEALSRELNIPLSSTNAIYSIEAEVMMDTMYLRKYDSFPSVFTVRLIVDDNRSIPSIQAGIQYYLENNDYAIKRKKARVKMLELQNMSYESKLKSLDSLREIVNNSIQPRSTGTGIILGEPIDPVSVYKAQDSFYKDLLRNQEKIALSDNIEVIQPFLEPADANYPNFPRLIVWIFSASLLLALLIFPFSRLGRPRSK